jgi:hypothetical protein
MTALGGLPMDDLIFLMIVLGVAILLGITWASSASDHD